MHQLLCIVGPTGTGKTSKAIEETRNQPSILVSADSRQVYRGMDIVTGKDHPRDTIIYGVDIVDPDQPCSVSVWYDAVIPHIERAWAEGKLPIVVGGTGLYVKALTEDIPTMGVPINQSLRDELKSLTLIQIQNKLKELDEIKFISMNRSDQNNPRRLIRAIEVAMCDIKPESRPASRQGGFTIPESTIIGLRYSVEPASPAGGSIQRNKIYERVMARLKFGAIDETKKLLQKYDHSLPSMSAIGYKSIIAFITNQIDEVTMINTWVNDELAYAKRQLTWFRKQPTIWYDVDTIGEL